MLRLGVVGLGLMGAAIAGLALAAGYDVSVFDADPDARQRAKRRLEGDGGPGRLTVCDDLTGLAGVDFVIEAIAENLAAKQALFARLDPILPDAILATNTSVLPVTEISARTTRPERVVGTHWWNPPQLIPVVEVVRGARTSDRTMDAACALLEGLGKTPVRVERDVPGFVGNRLQHALWREAIALVAEGVCDAATVDLMARNTLGLRLGTMGPIENADYVGLDLTLAIHEAVLPSLNRDPHPSPKLREMVAAGELGAKTGHGFLDWPAGAREAAAKRLADFVGRQVELSKQFQDV